MKKVILLLSLMCFVIFSQTVAQVALEYVEPSETYIMTKITSGGNNYWIINIEGEDTLLINPDPKLLTDKDEISNVILTKFNEDSMIEYKKNQAREFILLFNQSQYPDRKTCEQYTGVDKMPCYDKDSCLKACYAVPICSMIKNEQFILTIKDWNANKTELDEQFQKVLSELDSAKTSSDYSKVRSSINVLKSKMENLEKNGLYSVYGFCKKMNVSYVSLDSAKDLILQIEDSLSSENSVKQKANSIYLLTTERVNFVNERSALYTAIHLKVSDTFEECENNYIKSKVYDIDVENKISNASTYVQDMLTIKNQGNYRIAIQKGQSYYNDLVSLKNTINTLSIKRKEVDTEANRTLETITKSYSTLKKTKYDSNFTYIKNEVEMVFGTRINSTELTNVKELMVEYNDQIKDMVSDCVLNGCEIIIDENELNETNNTETPVNETLPENETEINDEVDEEVTPNPIISFLCKGVSFIERLLGIKLGFCR